MCIHVGLGDVWKWVEGKVGEFVKALLSKTGFKIPTFSIGMTILDDAVALMESAVDTLSSFETSFDNLLDFDSLEVRHIWTLWSTPTGGRDSRLARGKGGICLRMRKLPSHAPIVILHQLV